MHETAPSALLGSRVCIKVPPVSINVKTANSQNGSGAVLKCRLFLGRLPVVSHT